MESFGILKKLKHRKNETAWENNHDSCQSMRTGKGEYNTIHLYKKEAHTHTHIR